MSRGQCRLKTRVKKRKKLLQVEDFFPDGLVARGGGEVEFEIDAGDAVMADAGLGGTGTQINYFGKAGTSDFNGFAGECPLGTFIGGLVLHDVGYPGNHTSWNAFDSDGDVIQAVGALAFFGGNVKILHPFWLGGEINLPNHRFGFGSWRLCGFGLRFLVDQVTTD